MSVFDWLMWYEFNGWKVQVGQESNLQPAVLECASPCPRASI